MGRSSGRCRGTEFSTKRLSVTMVALYCYFSDPVESNISERTCHNAHSASDTLVLFNLYNSGLLVTDKGFGLADRHACCLFTLEAHHRDIAAPVESKDIDS